MKQSGIAKDLEKTRNRLVSSTEDELNFTMAVRIIVAEGLCETLSQYSSQAAGLIEVAPSAYVFNIDICRAA